MSEQIKPVRVRFAPSPTGHMHLGSGRTALYDYLIARKTGGEFILRIEDTDRKRYVPGAEKELIEGLHWLGLDWDEGPDIGGPYGPYRQSERGEIYREYARKLVEMGHAYFCFCTPDRLERVRQEQQKRKDIIRYDGTCRGLDPDEALRRVANGERHVIRFKAPREGSTTVHDLLRGEITVDNQTVDDFVLLKSDGLAVYHLAAMVDDHLMKITHVIRGSEWLPTFPLHALIYRAFGWQEPVWVHLSVFLKPSGKGKMSKREAAELGKDGYSIFIADLKQSGYIPEAVVNWIALMGWSYDDHTEFFTLSDLIDKFSLERLNPAPAAINFSKLDHFNGLHIRSLAIGDLSQRLRPYFEKAGLKVDPVILEKITPLVQQRITTLDDAVDIAGFFFREYVEPRIEELIGKDLSPQESAEIARKAYKALESVETFSAENTEAAMRQLVEELGLTAGQVFGILRIAITGQRVSPPLFESMEVIGKPKTLERIRYAVNLLENLIEKGNR